MKVAKLISQARRLQDVISMEQPAPVDALSQSLWEFGRELSELDALGKVLEADALGIDLPALESMTESYVRPLWA